MRNPELSTSDATRMGTLGSALRRQRLVCLGLVWAILGGWGCGGADPPAAPQVSDEAPAGATQAPGPSAQSGQASSSPAPQTTSQRQAPGPPSTGSDGSYLPDSPVSGFGRLAQGRGADRPADSGLPSASPRSAGDGNATAQTDTIGGNRGPAEDRPPRRQGPLTLVDVDLERLAESGLRHSRSPNLLLITDHPDLDSFAEFHDVFRQAVEQWSDFFKADPQRFRAWEVTCFLVVDETKFAAAGLLPGVGQLPQGKLPPGGWQYGNQIWVRHQPGPYYTRHMLLHEGTHAFSAFHFGALGPPWLAEGLAEFLAVHRWEGGQLELGARVTDRDALPYWGRVKLIRDAYQVGAPKGFTEVLRFPPQAFPQTDAYAWSWAAVSLWAGHPELREVFREHLQRLGTVNDGQWTRDLLQQVALTRDQLETQWQVDTQALRYGHDFGRTAIRWQDAQVLKDNAARWVLPADGAWHSSGWKLPAGQWRITATGAYTVSSDQEGPWISQPEGITIRYVQGAPLGQLQYALQGEQAILAGMSELTRPQALGSEAILRTSGEELFLRINDWPSHLEDNRGQVEVVLQKLP